MDAECSWIRSVERPTKLNISLYTVTLYWYPVTETLTVIINVLLNTIILLLLLLLNNTDTCRLIISRKAALVHYSLMTVGHVATIPNVAGFTGDWACDAAQHGTDHMSMWVCDCVCVTHRRWNYIRDNAAPAAPLRLFRPPRDISSSWGPARKVRH